MAVLRRRGLKRRYLDIHQHRVAGLQEGSGLLALRWVLSALLLLLLLLQQRGLLTACSTHGAATEESPKTPESPESAASSTPSANAQLLQYGLLLLGTQIVEQLQVLADVTLLSSSTGDDDECDNRNGAAEPGP